MAGIEDTLKALQEWESQQTKPQELPQHVQKNMEKAQAAVAQRQAHEEAVAPCKPANEELLAAYMAYIQLEQVFSCHVLMSGKLAAAYKTSINTRHSPKQSRTPLWLYALSIVFCHARLQFN